MTYKIKTEDQHEYLQLVQAQQLHTDIFNLDQHLLTLEKSDAKLEAGEVRQILRDCINDISLTLIFQ